MGICEVLQLLGGDLEAGMAARVFARILTSTFLTLMTALGKNVVINIRHQKNLTECSHSVAHSPSALAILAGFTALQQCPFS